MSLIHPFFILNITMQKQYTVLEILQLSSDYLEKKGIESPRVNAELLLADVLNCKRLDLYLKFDQPLKEFEINKYREFLGRRAVFEPYQYIIGKSEFYGRVFNVDKNILIPRPETELLVEEVINYGKSKSELKILDIGTGSGNIPITIALELPNSQLTSIDISSKAISAAINNSSKYEIKDHISFLEIDVFSDKVFSLNQKFDVIISNPPYVSLNDYSTVQKEILNFEPKEAVTDNGDGYKFYRRIAEISKKLLNENGVIFCEIAKNQSTVLNQLYLDFNYSSVNFKKDYQNIDRILVVEL